MLQPDPRRGDEVHSCLRSEKLKDVLPALWPKLSLISCWTDMHARAASERLAKMFPSSRIQPKGLLATEAFVSFPLEGRIGSALAITSHFLEFEPLSTEG